MNFELRSYIISKRRLFAARYKRKRSLRFLVALSLSSLVVSVEYKLATISMPRDIRSPEDLFKIFRGEEVWFRGVAFDSGVAVRNGVDEYMDVVFYNSAFGQETLDGFVDKRACHGDAWDIHYRTQPRDDVVLDTGVCRIEAAMRSNSSGDLGFSLDLIQEVGGDEARWFFIEAQAQGVPALFQVKRPLNVDPAAPGCSQWLWADCRDQGSEDWGDYRLADFEHEIVVNGGPIRYKMYSLPGRSPAAGSFSFVEIKSERVEVLKSLGDPRVVLSARGQDGDILSTRLFGVFEKELHFGLSGVGKISGSKIKARNPWEWINDYPLIASLFGLVNGALATWIFGIVRGKQ